MRTTPPPGKWFYRSSLIRRLMGAISVASGRSAPLRLSHLASQPDQQAIGPLQQPEALLLSALVKTVVPKTLVEFGFCHGLSAFNFLQAMAPDARLFSYDISPESAALARREFSRHPQFRFLHKSQAEFLHADIDHRMIDLVFFDASHDLRLNQHTFKAVYPALSEEALVCLHDTGLWHRDHFLDLHHAFVQERGGAHWLHPESYAHQHEERVFVNWILDTYPAFQAIHFHTSRALRHGLSVLQRKRRLETA